MQLGEDRDALFRLDDRIGRHIRKCFRLRGRDESDGETGAQFIGGEGREEFYVRAWTGMTRSWLGIAGWLVQCTLPHSNPGNVPLWKRSSGNATLATQPGIDIDIEKSIGYLYGTIPRLLLFWMVTEAIQSKTRRLVLGGSLAEFMRAVGLDPSKGGKRSDQKRLKDQMRRLFKCHISF